MGMRFTTRHATRVCRGQEMGQARALTCAHRLDARYLAGGDGCHYPSVLRDWTKPCSEQGKQRIVRNPSAVALSPLSSKRDANTGVRLSWACSRVSWAMFGEGDRGATPGPSAPHVGRHPSNARLAGDGRKLRFLHAWV